MVDFKRRVYKNPKIVGAVAQVLILWDQQQAADFTEFVKKSCAPSTDWVIGSRQLVDVQLNMDDDTDPVKLAKTTQAVFKNRNSAVSLYIDKDGIRSALEGEFSSSEELSNCLLFGIDQLSRFDASLVCRRTSVLYESYVSTEQRFLLSDYLTIPFDLPEQDFGVTFGWDLNYQLDLTELADGLHRGVIRIYQAPNNFGFNIVIDILAEEEIPLSMVKQKLSVAKQLETHVFELLITEKVREQYDEMSID